MFWVKGWNCSCFSVHFQKELVHYILAALSKYQLYRSVTWARSRGTKDLKKFEEKRNMTVVAWEENEFGQGRNEEKLREEEMFWELDLCPDFPKRRLLEGLAEEGTSCPQICEQCQRRVKIGIREECSTKYASTKINKYNSNTSFCSRVCCSLLYSH